LLGGDSRGRLEGRRARWSARCSTIEPRRSIPTGHGRAPPYAFARGRSREVPSISRISRGAPRRVLVNPHGYEVSSLQVRTAARSAYPEEETSPAPAARLPCRHVPAGRERQRSKGWRRQQRYQERFEAHRSQGRSRTRGLGDRKALAKVHPEGLRASQTNLEPPA
jgi:hypothetical protein